MVSGLAPDQDVGASFEEVVVPITDPENRAELLLLSPSVLVPRLSHDGATVWALSGEYLHEVRSAAGCPRTAWPGRSAARSAARCTRGSAISARPCP